MLEVTTDPPGLLDEPGGHDGAVLHTADDLDDLIRRARHRGANTLTIAAHPVDDVTGSLLTDAGFTCVREMLQLRRSLPADPPVSGVVVRPFAAEHDSERWLEVNRRAFAWHPDQGTWTAEDLRRRLAEDWFDASGFLVHDDPGGGGIDAFCWTKIHPASSTEPALGEIFVIAVDPDAHGRGLGRAMVLAGLDHLHHQGLAVAMLFVEADNAVGRQLYDALGFTTHEIHRWYRTTFAAD